MQPGLVKVCGQCGPLDKMGVEKAALQSCLALPGKEASGSQHDHPVCLADVLRWWYIHPSQHLLVVTTCPTHKHTLILCGKQFDRRSL